MSRVGGRRRLGRGTLSFWFLGRLGGLGNFVGLGCFGNGGVGGLGCLGMGGLGVSLVPHVLEAPPFVLRHLTKAKHEHDAHCIVVGGLSRRLQCAYRRNVCVY